MIRSLIAPIALAVAVVAALPATARDVAVGALTIGHPWSRPGLPNRPAAAYLSVTNTGETDDAIVAAASPAFGTVELHTVEMTGGVMAMRPVETIPLPAGETVALAPGGFHLMLFGAEAPFAEGESFPLVLTFAQAGEVEVTVTVERRSGGGAMNHGGHGDHGGMGN